MSWPKILQRWRFWIDGSRRNLLDLFPFVSLSTQQYLQPSRIRHHEVSSESKLGQIIDSLDQFTSEPDRIMQSTVGDIDSTFSPSLCTSPYSRGTLLTRWPVSLYFRTTDFKKKTQVSSKPKAAEIVPELLWNTFYPWNL